jgi:hypothetical protein
MFTKKYIGPIDCASCEKGIVNLNAIRAENINWNRLPFREPTERIARVSNLFLINDLIFSMVKDLVDSLLQLAHNLVNLF